MTESNSTNKNNKKLPWWVELLFVQIGLPDKWLPKFLKAKKNSNNFLTENKRRLFLLFIIFASAIYIKPIITESYNKNKCINWATKILSININDNNYKLKAKAINYCNGGIDL